MSASLHLAHIDPSLPSFDAHSCAVMNPQGIERAIIGLLTGIAEYAQSHLNLAGFPVAVSKQARPYTYALEAVKDLIVFGEVGRLHRPTLMACVERLSKTAALHVLALD